MNKKKETDIYDVVTTSFVAACWPRLSCLQWNPVVLFAHNIKLGLLVAGLRAAIIIDIPVWGGERIRYIYDELLVRIQLAAWICGYPASLCFHEKMTIDETTTTVNSSSPRVKTGLVFLISNTVCE
jgi:hypothetical protein